MRESNNVIQEEFLLLAERLKLDTRSIPLNVVGTPEYVPPTFIEKRIGQRALSLCIGPYIDNWRCDEALGRRLSVGEIESLVGTYKKLFLPHRQIRFIGVDLDDCLYDVTPIRSLLAQKITQSVVQGEVGKHAEVSSDISQTAWSLYGLYKNDLEPESVLKQKASDILVSAGFPDNTDESVEKSYNAYEEFSRLETPETRALYKTYEGVKDILSQLMSSGDFVVGILTNGPSRFQRNKIDVLGLKEGEHFNFVIASEDVGVGKQLRGFFVIATERASKYTNKPLKDEECLILDDQVRNLAGADGWLKVQYLKGYHSGIQPEDIREIPKYGITSFSFLTSLLGLEEDSDFQAMAAGHFVLKLLLLHRHEP